MMVRVSESTLPSGGGGFHKIFGTGVQNAIKQSDVRFCKKWGVKISKKKGVSGIENQGEN